MQGGEVMQTQEVTECGHTTSNGGWTFTCNRPHGHAGLHRETVKLRDGTSRTDWGDDGKATWATADKKRLAAG
jgi:hypothetical protein